MIASIATWCCTLQLNMFLKISEWGKLSGCFLWLPPVAKLTRGQGDVRPPWPVISKFLGPLSPHC